MRGWSRRDKLYTGSGETATDVRLLDPATEPARVRAMFVRSDWTRRGLGTMILEASEAAAAAEGFRSLSLMATEPGSRSTSGTGSRSSTGHRCRCRMDARSPAPRWRSR